jgi:RNase P subunit RPR2
MIDSQSDHLDLFDCGRILSARVRCPRGHEAEIDDLCPTVSFDVAEIVVTCPECGWKGRVY